MHKSFHLPHFLTFTTPDILSRFQALEELFLCDGEEFTKMDESNMKFHAGYLNDTTFIAAVQKKK